MNDRATDRVMDHVRRACGPLPADPAAAILGIDWPEPGDLPCPWRMWTLVGLIRHWQRQQWAASIIVEKLGGDLHAIAQCGYGGHPPIPQSGPVPDHADWEYYFHGRGCCLTQRLTGLEIDVDFYDASPDHLEYWFYSRTLKTMKPPPFPEARLLAMHPSMETIRLSMNDLASAGWLIEGERKTPTRLHPHAKALQAYVHVLDAPETDTLRRLWVCAHLGDWLFVAEAAAKIEVPQLKPFAERLAAQWRRARSNDLTTREADDFTEGNVLTALHELNDPATRARLLKALAGPARGATTDALRIIRSSRDAQWCAPLYNLIQRLNPNDNLPAPHVWAEAVEFLFEMGYRVHEVAALLPRAARAELTRLFLLAARHAPKYAADLLRRALRSEVPIDRLCSSALLGCVDKAWSRVELVAVLNETDDWENAMYALAALEKSEDLHARHFAERWRQNYPHESEPGTMISIREWSIRSAPQDVEFYMSKYRDAAANLVAPFQSDE